MTERIRRPEGAAGAGQMVDNRVVHLVPDNHDQHGPRIFCDHWV